MELGLVRDGGGFRRVVVAHQREHAAVLRGAGHVGVAEDVARAVDARALAVPHAEDAVVAALAAHLGLLRAPDGGGGEFLVETGLEDDVRGIEPLLGAQEVLVEPAERRAAIAGDEAGGVQPGEPIPLPLHQEHPDDRLRPGDEDAVLCQVVLVVQRDVAERSARFGHSPVPPEAFGTPIALSRL